MTTGLKTALLSLAFTTLSANLWAAVTYTSDSGYQKYSYSTIIDWRGTSGIFHSGAVVELNADGTDGASYSLNTSGHPWQVFAENQSQYSTPGLVLRLKSSTAIKAIEAQFSPWTFGGLIVEESGYSFVPQNNNSRGVTFGDPSGTAETFIDIHEDFTIKRGSTEANYKNGFFGTVNLTVDEGKTFDYNSVQSGHELYVHSSWPRKGTAVASCLKMHGAGKLKVAKLTATGNVTLDYSDLAKSHVFITGNLAVNNSTKLKLPAGVAEGESYQLCSGTLTVENPLVPNMTIVVGSETVENVTLSYSGNTVSYSKAVNESEATINGTSTLADLSWSKPLSQGVVSTISVSGDSVLTLDETATPLVGLFKITGSSSLTIKNAERLDLSLIDFAGFTGALTLEYVNQNLNASAASALRTFITTKAATIALNGTTIDLGNISNVKTRFVATANTSKITLKCEDGAANVKIFNGDSKDNPFIKVLDGATLTIVYANFTGWNGAVTDGWIVNEGTLNFQSLNGSGFFRNHIVLTDGHGMTMDNTTGSAMLVYGGATSADAAQIQLLSGSAEISGTTNAKGICFGNSFNDGDYGSNAENKKVGINIGPNATLTISALVTKGKTDAKTGPLVKWGAGTLVLSNADNTYDAAITLKDGIIKSKVELANVTAGDAAATHIDPISDDGYYVYVLGRTEPARVVAQNWAFDSFKLEDGTVTKLIDGDTVIIQSTLAETIGSKDAWHATDDGEDCPIYGHPVEINREMNWKLPISTMVANAQVYVRDGGSIVANANVTGTGTLNLVSAVTAAGAGTLNVTLAGSGKLTKNGEGTLTISKTNNGFSGGVTVAAGTVVAGAANAFGTGMLTVENGAEAQIVNNTTAYDVTLNGGTLKCKGVNDAHGKLVKSLTLGADSVMEWMTGGGQLIGIGANNLACTLALANRKLTMRVNGKAQYDRVYLDKVTISSAGTLEVTQGRFFVHCSKPDLSECKLVIGVNATIEVAGEIQDKTLTIKDLVYNGTVAPNSSDTAVLKVTGTYEGTGSYPNLTLTDGVTINVSAMPQDGVVAKAGSLTATGSYNLTIGGVASDDYTLAVVDNTLVATEKPLTVATLWSTPFTTLEAAIAQAKEMAIGMGQEDENALLKDIVLTVPFTAQLPDGYELVFSDTDDRLHIQAVTTAAQYIVISPRNYVTEWTTYVAARAESPVAAGITFAVKAADEIYAAYPAKADNVNGDPRNDAESIHKYIGMMQAKGAKYFVLGGRWKGIDTSTKTYNPQTDRATIIPGIAVYPKLPKADASPLDIVSSDLYYACHYKADGQKYVWDPSNDGVYVGLMETAADQMDDVRHFQPNCVVSRMDLYGELKNTTARNYQQCIADYKTKIVKVETQAFSGADRYVAWTAQCKSFDASGRPDVYGVMTDRLNSINTARGAKELLHLVYLGIEPTAENNYLTQAMSEELLAENKASLFNGNWEVFLPFGHGTPDGFAGLDTEAFGTNSGLAKFFMGNIPCLTGSQTAECNAASAALANPNGGALVSVNNSSYGYLTDQGITTRYCGLSDELADHCLDTYVGGATAGESWQNAISVFAGKVLSTEGFKNDALVARGHEGSSEVTLHAGKNNEKVLTVPDKNYVIAAMIQENLFGDPLVKIQTEKGTSQVVASATTPAAVYALPSLAAAIEKAGTGDTVTLLKTTIEDEAVMIPAGRTFEVSARTSLVAKGGLTVNGSLTGGGAIDGAVTFGAGATLDASGASKLSLAAGSELSVDNAGVNLILPSGTTAIPAATTMIVMNQAGLTGTWKVASAKAAGSNSELSGTIELIAANDAIFVIDSSNLVKLDSIQTGKGAVIESVVIVNGEDETPAVMESKKYFLIPSGATIKVTYRPDLDHSGAEQTITVENVTSVGTVTGAMTGYAGGRAPATVFVDGDSNVTYTGDMKDQVLLPEGEATSGTYVEHRTSIVAGDTVVFDVAHHLEDKTVVVMADAAGAELHIDANLTMIPGEAAAILGGKRVDVQDGHTLTFKPTATYDLTLGSGVSFNGGTVMMTTDNAAKFIKTDSLEGASLIDIRSPLVIKPATAAGTIAWSGRLAGNGTIEGAVAVHAGAHLIVRGTEFLTVPNLTSHEHRLTIDAMASTPVKGGDGKFQPLTVLKVADKATAEALIPNLTLVEPELTHADGKRVLFQLAATDDGSIVMKELEFVITEGFFTNGVLGHNEEVVWKHGSAFASGDYGISVMCPAEIAFDFTGADSKATITVAKPITLSGSGALTFDVPTGRTVYVNCTISGNAGVTKTGGGTLIFGLPEGMTEEGGQEGENARAGWNTFYGALTVEEGTVRSTKGHGYGARHVVDGETDVPEIEIHSGATLDLAHICDQEMLEIITAGTITNSFHHASGATVGQIKQLTLKGDATVTGHTFGMARDSIINLQGHVLTISMERGECVTETIAPGKTEVRDHEFELNNTKVLGGRDNLATPDIIVRQGTLSCEGSTYADGVFTMGDNDLLDAALYVGAEGCLRLDANLTVKRIQMVNGNQDVVVPCDENPDGTPADAHTHTFKKVWEESLKPDADPTSDADNKYFGHIIIRQELKGGISAPRLTLGRIGDPTKSLHDADDNMNSPEIRRIVLDKGEYIDCQQEFVMTAGKIGSQFNVFFLDWTGESGARRIFHGWEKFSHDLSLSEILNPYGVKPRADGGYRLMLGDWYPYGSYAFKDDPVSAYNTLPLEDQNWAYAISLWPYVEDGEERPYDIVNTLITTITHLDGEPIYDPTLKPNQQTGTGSVHNLYDNVLVTTNGLLKCYCQRGDGKMDFVIGEAWIKQYMGADKYYEYMGEAMYLGGNGTISKWLNAKGANGIERWQSYMLGLDPTKAHSLPVLAVRKDVAPSVTKMVDGEEKTFVNVKIAGTTVYGYQYISPVYAIEELDPATMEPKVVNPGARNEAEKKHTPWQSSINFQVEVPTKVDAQGKAVPAYDHVKYFRVKVSFQGNDGITN